MTSPLEPDAPVQVAVITVRDASGTMRPTRAVLSGARVRLLLDTRFVAAMLDAMADSDELSEWLDDDGLPLPPARCGVCGADMGDSDELARQIRNGVCDRCQRERYRAALLYIQASDNLRMIWALWRMAGGEGRGPNTREGHQHPTVEAMTEAERRCVELKMWPPTRTEGRADRYVNPNPQVRADSKDRA